MITDLIYGLANAVRQAATEIKHLSQRLFCHHEYVLIKGPLIHGGMDKLIYYTCRKCGRSVWHTPPDELMCHEYYMQYNYMEDKYDCKKK